MVFRMRDQLQRKYENTHTPNEIERVKAHTRATYQQEKKCQAPGHGASEAIN